MKTIEKFEEYKFRQVKKANLGTAPDFRGENWELLKEILYSVAKKDIKRMRAHLYYKLAHKLICR